jgi:hypothetical protein
VGVQDAVARKGREGVLADNYIGRRFPRATTRAGPVLASMRVNGMGRPNCRLGDLQPPYRSD